MSFKRIPLLILVLALLLSTTTLIFAQDDPAPLLDMLALVPDQPHNNLYFTDYAAIAAAYPQARIPVDTAEYQALVWRCHPLAFMATSTV